LARCGRDIEEHARRVDSVLVFGAQFAESPSTHDARSLSADGLRRPDAQLVPVPVGGRGGGERGEGERKHGSRRSVNVSPSPVIVLGKEFALDLKLDFAVSSIDRDLDLGR
jgi:hypothetical protein